MRLSKLYSNHPTVFEPLFFAEGLNIVLAEIRLPENKDKDTHNLGKTTLGQLIDFCLLSTRDSDMFLIRYPALFSSFVFYIELSLLDGTFVTVKRGVSEASKISFKRYNLGLQDFSDIPDSMWDHSQMPFDRSREMLDGILNLSGLRGLVIFCVRRMTTTTFFSWPVSRRRTWTGSRTSEEFLVLIRVL